MSSTASRGGGVATFASPAKRSLCFVSTGAAPPMAAMRVAISSSSSQELSRPSKVRNTAPWTTSAARPAAAALTCTTGEGVAAPLDRTGHARTGVGAATLATEDASTPGNCRAGFCSNGGETASCSAKLFKTKSTTSWARSCNAQGKGLQVFLIRKGVEGSASAIRQSTPSVARNAQDSSNVRAKRSRHARRAVSTARWRGSSGRERAPKRAQSRSASLSGSGAASVYCLRHSSVLRSRATCNAWMP
mmetsp:Transcript_22549/g.64956  ORF Transcript_22549/g.64956 Transcript_22549/m.64956 type:complete len:247 (+) Transcript_22549:271-1011(+)